MFLFVLMSFGLCVLLQNNSAWLALLLSSAVLDAGMGLMAAGWLAAVLRPGWLRMAVDAFAVGTLLVWFGHWQPLFKDGSPVFFAFALYLALMGAAVELALLGQQARPDPAALGQMRAFARASRVQPWLVMLVAAASLGLTEHYLLYPVAMTVLAVRVALQRYLAAAE